MKTVEPTVADFDELLSYLPLIYANGFKPISRWIGGDKTDEGVLIMPWPEYEEVVDKFFGAAGQQCWTDFDYTSKNIGKVVRDPERVACATLEEIKTMLTWCVRGERFCVGHWETVIENGFIRSILLRLQALKPQ